MVTDAMPFAFFGVAFGFLILFSLVGCLLFYLLFIYFLAPQPNRLISSLLNYKVYGAAIIFLLVGIARLLNELLALIGMRSGSSYTWDMVAFRYGIVCIILSIFLWWIAKTYFTKNIFNAEMTEGKTPVGFTGHAIHYILSVALLVMATYLLFLIGDYVLGFVLVGGYQPAFKDWLMDVLTLVLPTLFLYIVLFKSLVGKMRITPGIISLPFSIFKLLLFILFLAALTVVMSNIAHDFTASIYAWTGINSPLEYAPQLDDYRNLLISFILSLGGLWWVIRKGKMSYKVVPLKTK